MFNGANITISCKNCGELLYESLIQRNNVFTRFKCMSCETDIEIDDESLISIELVERLREKKPELFKQLVGELFPDEESEELE